MKYFSVVAALVFLFSCKEEKPRNYLDPIKSKVENSAIRPVEILFDDADFQNDTVISLLRETQLCESPNREIDINNPPCSPKFFKVLPFTKRQKLNNAFMVQVKALVGGFPLRRLFIYQREKNKLVLANRFMAKVIEFRDNPRTGYDDLVLVFNDVIDNHDYRYTCLYQWTGLKYDFVSCEEIDYNKVKATYKDSMSIEIKKIIDRKDLAL